MADDWTHMIEALGRVGGYDLDALDEKISSLQTLLHRLKALRKALSVPPVTTGEGTYFDRILGFMRDKSSPVTINDIAAGTGVPRPSVAAVVYRTHRDYFLRRPLPGRGRRGGWVLRESLGGD